MAKMVIPRPVPPIVEAWLRATPLEQWTATHDKVLNAYIRPPTFVLETDEELVAWRSGRLPLEAFKVVYD